MKPSQGDFSPGFTKLRSSLLALSLCTLDEPRSVQVNDALQVRTRAHLTSLAHQIDAVHHLVLSLKSVLPHDASRVGHSSLPDVTDNAAAGRCWSATTGLLSQGVPIGDAETASGARKLQSSDELEGHGSHEKLRGAHKKPNVWAWAPSRTEACAWVHVLQRARDIPLSAHACC